MYNRKQYKLVNLDNGNIIILDGQDNNVEPRNWDQADYTYKRSTKTLAETRVYSKDLEFTMNGAKFLRDAYLTYDVEAKVQMFEIRFNPRTSVPYEYFIGEFDFNTFTDEITFVSVAFDTDGLNKLLKTKGNNKLELDRKTDINGDEISDLIYNEFEVVNRPLFLNSLLETSEEESFSNSFRMRFGDDYRYGFFSIPFDTTFESDDSVSGIPNGLFNVIGATRNVDLFLNFDPLKNNILQLFYYNSDRDKQIDVTFNIELDGIFKRNNNLEEHFCELALVTFKGGENPVFQVPNNTIVSPQQLNDLDDYKSLLNINSLAQGTSQNISYNETLRLNIQKGDSLGLFIIGGGEFNVFVGASALDLDFDNIKSSIELKENSLVDDLPRKAQFIFNKKVGERLSECLTGEVRYKSNFFTSGDFKLTGLTTGKKIRGFDDSKITTSWKDFSENSQYLYSMGWNIEFYRGQQIIRHEKLNYFFRPETVVKIPNQVNKVKRTVANDFIYSTLTYGYKKPSGDNLYEEVQGLNEYNTKNEYLTPITTSEKEFDAVSPYRADSEGKELTVRQHKKVNPTGDYRTDNDLFNIDLKESGTEIYKERIWSDDFEELPKNIFSPETATGLRLTPSSMLERNAWLTNNAYTKFNTKSIRYASTIGNSDLITKKVGESEKAENQDFVINQLENPIFVSQWIEFEYPLDFDLLETVNSTKFVNGENIPNTYFKVEFINEFNQKEYGYLFELKPNKEGKWKLLKAF